MVNEQCKVESVVRLWPLRLESACVGASPVWEESITARCSFQTLPWHCIQTGAEEKFLAMEANYMRAMDYEAAAEGRAKAAQADVDDLQRDLLELQARSDSMTCYVRHVRYESALSAAPHLGGTCSKHLTALLA